jgi:hypothetical protein
MSADDCLSQAEEDCLCTPENLLNELLMHLNGADEYPPVDLAAWRRRDMGDVETLDVRGLMALLMSGNHQELILARCRLREIVLTASKDWILDRAKEL